MRVSRGSSHRAQGRTRDAIGCRREDPHGRRQPSAVHQGRGRLRAAARAATRRSSCTPASTTTIRSRACSSPSSASRARIASWASAAARTRQQTARMLAALEPLLASSRPTRCSSTATPTRRSPERWPRRRRASGRARRGGHALVRPRDARGAQPRAHRSPVDAAAVPVGHGRGEPARGVRRRPCGGRRRRDGRRRDAPPAVGARRRRRRWPRTECAAASTCC